MAEKLRAIATPSLPSLGAMSDVMGRVSLLSSKEVNSSSTLPLVATGLQPAPEKVFDTGTAEGKEQLAAEV